MFLEIYAFLFRSMWISTFIYFLFRIMERFSPHLGFLFRNMQLFIYIYVFYLQNILISDIFYGVMVFYLGI